MSASVNILNFKTHLLETDESHHHHHHHHFVTRSIIITCESSSCESVVMWFSVFPLSWLAKLRSLENLIRILARQPGSGTGCCNHGDSGFHFPLERKLLLKSTSRTPAPLVKFYL
ncbi:unnamed protein product [Cuscuta europaea]|uniref:Uncharacterized protein n=1 Tax=Cuscuta europaea TaxID=41803 RepID=A0A9P0ZG65_CUSEU|nr:unnamed protein product [Cuscuta europaea]